MVAIPSKVKEENFLIGWKGKKKMASNVVSMNSYRPYDKTIKIGDRVRVRCICGDKDCVAPASKGGEPGELVNIKDNIYSVVFDDDRLNRKFEESYGDFPAFSVKKEKEA